MIYLYMALYQEAKPVLRALKLKRIQTGIGFDVYEGGPVRLILTGVGSLAAATAVAASLAYFRVGEGDHLLNWGSCAAERKTRMDGGDPQVRGRAALDGEDPQAGERGGYNGKSPQVKEGGSSDGSCLSDGEGCSEKAGIGAVYLCNRLVDRVYGRTYYPDMLIRTSLPEACVVTESQPWRKADMATEEESCTKSDMVAERESCTRSDVVTESRPWGKAAMATEGEPCTRSDAVTEVQPWRKAAMATEGGPCTRSDAVTEVQPWRKAYMATEGEPCTRSDAVTEAQLWRKADGCGSHMPGEGIVLHDMEAAAVYYAGSFFMAPDQMHFLKVVTDYGVEEREAQAGAGEPSRGKQGRTVVSEAMRRTLDEVMERSAPALLEYIRILSELTGCDGTAPPAGAADERPWAAGGSPAAAGLPCVLSGEAEQICEELRCSQTMRAAVRQCLRYWTLTGTDYQGELQRMRACGELPCRDKREGIRRFEQLKAKLL